MFELFIPNSVGEVLIKLYNVSYGINFDILCGLLSMSKWCNEINIEYLKESILFDYGFIIPLFVTIDIFMLYVLKIYSTCLKNL